VVLLPLLLAPRLPARLCLKAAAIDACLPTPLAVSSYRTEDYKLLGAAVAIGAPWGYIIGEGSAAAAGASWVQGLTQTFRAWLPINGR
jgi:hypothetical protein